MSIFSRLLPRLILVTGLTIMSTNSVNAELLPVGQRATVKIKGLEVKEKARKHTERKGKTLVDVNGKYLSRNQIPSFEPGERDVRVQINNREEKTRTHRNKTHTYHIYTLTIRNTTWTFKTRVHKADATTLRGHLATTTEPNTVYLVEITQ